MTTQTFNFILIVWCGMAVVSFLALLFITSPYGRHSQDSWRPFINGTIGWILMELPAAIIFAWVYAIGSRPTDFYSIAFLVLWEFHYLHRTFIFAFRRRKMARPISLYVVLFSLCFNGFNAFLNSYWINILSAGYPKEWFLNPMFIVGICLFFGGFWINFSADEKLLKLKRQGGGYKVPEGGLYNYITCPNYFGEIVEWFGFALATLSPAAFAFVLWTLANLVPRAISHHKWYHSQFSDYPKERKAIFPFLL